MAPTLAQLAPARPAIHLAPQQGWMNDPNGLFHDGTRWHAYYQHDPTTDTHSVMHWGHASSTDLLAWEHHPIALAPDEHGMIFSGSAVVDTDGTAGFGRGAVVAIFTHDQDGKQRQSLAFSTDSGYSWTKYAQNPVLESESDALDFRDPKVARINGAWCMALAVGDRIEFHSSPNLRHWTLTGDYSYDLPGSGVWECPDLVAVPGANGPEWLLTYCLQKGGPHGHSATVYVPGRVDCHRFEGLAEPRSVDWGPDFYAMQTFSGAPQPNPVAMAWMSSWQYSSTHPSAGRRGVLSLPRALSIDAEGRLCSVPKPGLRCGRTASRRLVQNDDTGAVVVRSDGDFSVVLRQEDRAEVMVSVSSGVASLERRGEIVPGFEQRYEVELDRSGEHQLVLDQGTVELFAAGGSATISALAFLGSSWEVEVTGNRTEVQTIRAS